MKTRGSSLWKVFKKLWKASSSVIWVMRVGTMGLSALFIMRALFHLEELWMVLLLLPTMTEWTKILILAPSSIRYDYLLCLPISTYLFRICKQLGFSSIVLPIVCVNAYIPLMVLLSVRTPDRLEMEQVKVHVWLKLFYEFY